MWLCRTGGDSRVLQREAILGSHGELQMSVSVYLCEGSPRKGWPFEQAAYPWGRRTTDRNRNQSPGCQGVQTKTRGCLLALSQAL